MPEYDDYDPDDAIDWMAEYELEADMAKEEQDGGKTPAS